MDFLELLRPGVLAPWILGMVFGIFVGAMPGLTATMAVALIVPFSFYLPDPAMGLALIIGVSFTAIFAGDIPATYLRIPGTPASAAATLDGHAMASQGKGGLALTIDLLCSALGGLLGVLLLMAVAPQLARFALRFSHFEYFWLALFGLAMSALVSTGSTGKGVLAAGFGMLLATVGRDIVSNTPRYTFGVSNLGDGIEFIPAMIGLFGLSEVIRLLWTGTDPGHGSGLQTQRAEWKEAFYTVWRRKWLWFRSSVLGTLIGALPGAGADIAAWGSYGAAQKLSKTPRDFGHGSTEGVVAPTSANNAAIAGAWIPALVFGIPGDAVTAIVLGALIMYNIKPGPLIFEQSAAQVNTIFAIALITQLLLIPCGYLGIRAFGWILRMPRSLVLTGVTLFSLVGAYAIRNNLFDIYVMAAFGVLGFFMDRNRIPLPPLILGLILGPMVEENLRTGLIKTEGDWLPFVTRPLSALLCVLLLLTLFSGPVWSWIKRQISTK